MAFPKTVKEYWTQVQEEIERSATRAGRNPNTIQVMAVTKTRTAERVQEAKESGLKLFGENRVDEALKKFQNLSAEDFPLYMIGHLQGNKAGRIDSRYAGVHSVDSVKLAERLSAYREKIQCPLEILIQVNTSGESTKSGFADSVLLAEAAEKIARMPFLILKGIMTMAPFVNDEAIVRNCFSLCREWGMDLSSLLPEAPILSMGMSSDYKWAIAEGSTLLRIGTGIFGENL